RPPRPPLFPYTTLFRSDRAFATRHLDCPYGKTEAWFVLEAEPDAAVHLGWREDVDPAELAERRDRQDSAWMLSRMNRVPVRAGRSEEHTSELQSRSDLV